ncbi:hypothetical protein BKH41_07220 [Helicobacter sp. 12S02232-10]|uniref:hypothetical protein n=1 Tax=Helicobacter sp. 12S02232-10 TaxID=1476197 RepID=UPI000BA6829B|nr:hypothetical protein [Helicobacter sp. 12S02232-10]PAF47672.1 hypothetical protein BKH41_07220 [Helicobacter sp. 12S02232-10]
MSKSVTLYIKDNRELRIAKNFLIISILLYVLYILIAVFSLSQLNSSFSYLSVFLWVMKILCFSSNVAGFYKLSKLGRSSVLFKNYMFSVIGMVAFTIIIYLMFKIFFGVWVFDIQKSQLEMALTDPVLSWIFLFAGIFYFGLNVYWSYKICFELTFLSGDIFFINGFKIIISSVSVALLANIMFFVSENQISSFLFLLSMIGMLVGSLILASGFFRLKQITYVVSE